VQVKKNPSVHHCTSTRRTKNVKNATKFWVCEKVKNWLIEDATLGAKELQRRIKEHHKVKIHYKRVYMGKDLALKQLFKTCNYEKTKNSKSDSARSIR
jgi:ribosomal protein L37AE/L43A